MNKPATPLPWHTRGPMKGGIPLFIEAPKNDTMPYALDVCGDDYTGYGDEAAREQNMRYICHAANAYPKLVETLLRVNNAILKPGSELAVAVKTVLRELGELS